MFIASISGYIYDDLFVPDDTGAKYNQNWQSDDGQIEFVVSNSKGFMGHNMLYDGNATIDGESINIELGFALLCEMYTDDLENRIFAGEYNYNPVFNQVTVKITEVDSNYSNNYKVGETLILKKE